MTQMVRCCACKTCARDYPLPRTSLLGRVPQVHALRGVSLDIHAGRSPGRGGRIGLGQVHAGAAGDGARHAQRRQRGAVGRDLHRLTACELRARGATCRWCSRTPTARWTCARRQETIVTEPLQALANATKAELRERAAEVLAQVGLRAGDAPSTRMNFPAASASASPSPAP